MASSKSLIKRLLLHHRIPGRIYYSRRWHSWMIDFHGDNSAPQKLGNCAQAISMIADGHLDFMRELGDSLGPAGGI